MDDPVDVDALRAHQRRTHREGDDYGPICVECRVTWPCEIAHLLADLEATRQRLADTTTALREISRLHHDDSWDSTKIMAAIRIAEAALAAVAPAPPDPGLSTHEMWLREQPVAAAPPTPRRMQPNTRGHDSYHHVEHDEFFECWEDPPARVPVAPAPPAQPTGTRYDLARAFGWKVAPVAAAPPTEPPKDFVRCFHDDIGEHGSWVWHHPNYHDKGSPVAPAPPTRNAADEPLPIVNPAAVAAAPPTEPTEQQPVPPCGCGHVKAAHVIGTRCAATYPSPCPCVAFHPVASTGGAS